MKIRRRTFGKLMASIPFFGVLDETSSLTDAQATDERTQMHLEDEPGSRPWYETNRRWTTFNAHFQDWDPIIASRLDAKAIIRSVTEANANVFMMFALDCLGNAYYPSRFARLHPNLPSNSLLAEIVSECRKNGIAIIFYFCVNWNKHVAERHPEWTMKDYQNKTPGYDGILGPYLCYNSAYLDYVKSVSSELLEYDPDGIFYDMLWYGEGKVCYCLENCQPLFRKKYGTEIPLAAGWDETWRKFLEFRYDSNFRFAQELAAHVRRLRPKSSVGFNYHGQPRFSWQNAMQPVRHSRMSDYGTGETAMVLGGTWFPSMLTTFARSLRPGKPVMMATTRGLGGGYCDYTLRPEADLKWETFTFLSHGTHAFIIDDALHDGSLQPEVYKLMGRVFAEAKEKEPLFGYQHMQEVGLYYSLKSRDWYGREQPERYQDAFVGAYRALRELHIPVDALFDESASLDRLKQYPVVYLANTAILDQQEAEILRQYVTSGGCLLATQDTGLFDRNGQLLGDFIIADLLGIRYKGKVDFATHYYRPTEGWLGTDIGPTWDVLTHGEANLVETTGAVTHGELKLPFHDGPPFHPIDIGSHNSPWKIASAAVYTNRYGKGQTAYIPFGPDAAYIGKFPMPEHRKFLRNVVRRLYPNPPIRVEAPLTVEVVITNDPAGNRHILHFIGYQAGRVVDAVGSPRIPNVMEEPLLYRAKIEMREIPRQVTSVSHKTQIRREGNNIQLQIEDVHEAIIIDC